VAARNRTTVKMRKKLTACYGNERLAQLSYQYMYVRYSIILWQQGLK